ncbi:YpiF family protein [Bacillus norwichensis]|uniref:YpiF family protein n=1 Tax=Bacillus norwichensis TaxID=2762217 RepID=A0ABR8VNL8_9BACI|nr:YpiF family protein [Bacillus norwichensis]MBD8006364.1 YpiF family protein [Bacillus norwichensis]
MQWKTNDIEVYLEEKEYIDTAVVPLIPISLGRSIKQSVEQGEFIQLLSLHLERQFKGRMLFLPACTYLSDHEESKKFGDLLEWEKMIKDSGFKFVFFLTSDQIWRSMEQLAPESLLFIPSIPLNNMDDQYKQSIMEDQVKQLMKEIVKGWQSSY